MANEPRLFSPKNVPLKSWTEVRRGRTTRYFIDAVTRMLISIRRQEKKALLKTFASPTGRQLRKHKRWLRENSKTG